MAEKFKTDIFQQTLKSSYIGKNIVYSDVTGSTMDDARKFGVSDPEKYPHGTVVMAERQTKARGARDHKWDATNTGNIYVSIILHMPQNFKTFEGRFDLEAAGCMAVRKVVQALGVNVIPKWPNDLWIRGHKLAGFLAEDSRFDIPGSNFCLIVLGMGINVNADIRQNPELYSIATSLMCERNGVPVCREDFFADVCSALEDTIVCRSEVLSQFCTYNLFQEGCDISVTCSSENRVIDGKFLEVCDNWDIKFVDKRTKDTLQGRSDYFTIRPKVHSKILVVFAGYSVTKSAAAVASRFTSIIDSSKHVVCAVPESAITQSEEWMKTCDLLVLAEDVCDGARITSKVTKYLKRGGNLLSQGVASYFTAKMFDIPFKEGVLQSFADNTDFSFVSLEYECGSENETESQNSSKVTFPSSFICFKFSKDYAVGNLSSKMETLSVGKENGDHSKQLGDSQAQKKHMAVKYCECEQEDELCIAVLTRPTTHGGCIGIFGFDFGVTVPHSSLPSGHETTQGDNGGITKVENIFDDVEKDRFKRDKLIYQVLNILNVT